MTKDCLFWIVQFIALNNVKVSRVCLQLYLEAGVNILLRYVDNKEITRLCIAEDPILKTHCQQILKPRITGHFQPAINSGSLIYLTDIDTVANGTLSS
jgi:hypothetical protein